MSKDKFDKAIDDLRMSAMNISYIPKIARKIVIRDRNKTYIKK